MGCRVPAPAPDPCVTSALHVSHEDVSCGPSSWKPLGSEFWEMEPCLAKLTNPSPISFSHSGGWCVLFSAVHLCNAFFLGTYYVPGLCQVLATQR